MSEKIEYLADPREPSRDGWYIICYDADDSQYSYDACGPYESEAVAREIQQRYPLGTKSVTHPKS